MKIGNVVLRNTNDLPIHSSLRNTVFSINSLNLESLFHREGGFVLSFTNPIKQDRKLMFPPLAAIAGGAGKLSPELLRSDDQWVGAPAHKLRAFHVVVGRKADAAPQSER